MAPALKGKLLVATPTLEGPTFSRTVIYMVEHSVEGGVGVVLNRPTEAPLDEPFPTWSSFAADPRVLFIGGPVQTDGVLCLGRVTGAATDDETVGLTLLPGGLALVDLERHPLDMPVVQELRIFAGYSGWGPRQLEREIVGGSWFVVETEAGDVLTRDPDDMWRRVLRRQGGKLALFANAPPELSLN